MSLAADPTPAEAGFAKAFAAVTAPDAVRKASWETFVELGLPHKRVEEWKWTDLRRVLADAPAPADGVTYSRNPDAAAPLASPPTTALPALAAALSGDAEVFELSDGERLTIDVQADGGVHRIIGVTVPAGATASVEERYAGGAGAFANVGVLYRLGEGARLERVVTQAESPEAVIVSSAAVELSARAVLNQAALAFGAKLARLETHVTHAGEGASATLNGAYLLDGQLHADQTTTVAHEVPHGVTRETFKGVVAGQATGVFQGKIKVERPAQKTDARMRHDALLLSDKAAANAKPELEIYADDVECAHGNTVGALDPAQLFYMRSRGLEESRAKALLIEAFLGEAVDGVRDDATRARLREHITAWLGTRL